ncbi:MAG: hypothetical protein GXO89_03735 [Chlorobi bacterium]|nr:hypothetical protein [Chlorobiota bacterium]
MPIGNSITQLDNQHYSYRYKLWKKLIDDGVDFDFVGSMTDHYNCGTPTFPDYNGHTFDTGHEGHWGWRCDEIINGGNSSNCKGTGHLSTWLGSYTPDIALIHLGTNDMVQGQSVSGTINELKDIINILRADNPNVIILLAKLIPANESLYPTWASRIPLLNAEIPSIATDMQDENSPIVIVDQFSGFDPTTDTFDGVHTNSLGEEKMAQKWFDAIQSAVGSGFGLNIKTYLEGPYNGSEMNTSLMADIPLQQPFNSEPWNYAGTETLGSLPPNIVDWVLMDIRDATDAASATESTRLERKAALLLSNGSVVDMDGVSDITFNSSVTNQLFVVVHHQNHLPVLSANPLIENNGTYAYDFTTAVNQAYGNSQSNLGNGVFGMVAGDFNADGVIDSNDISIDWNLQAGMNGYYQSDANLNSNVDNSDKNIFWHNNQGLSSALP